jgi:NodT family efflux transporter outer membrane factor (OMF) lipoprotein
MKRSILLAPLAALAACTPSPHTSLALPAPPAPSTVAITPVSGAPQQLVAAETVPSRWWTSFGSAKLDALVDEALAHNNDLAVADATLRQSREQAASTAGAQGPQVDAGYQAQRIRVSRSLSNPLPDPDTYLYTLHTAQLSVTYPVDVFGAGRNHVRSARAAATAAAARLQAARATVAANLVLAVIQRSSLTAQVAATKSAIENDRELVELLRRRQQLGDIGEVDVAAQQTALATVEAQLPALERQLAHQEGLIATLLGRAPGAALPELPGFDELALPATLPLSVPADIVRHRPDVLAAEAQVHGAAADLGAAIAARLPSIQLSGTAGGSATRFADMFADGNPFYTLIGGITAPIFHSHQLLHQQRAARAALEGTEAQYRSTALQAFLDVDDAIAGLRTDAVALDAATRANDAATRTLFFTRRQVELGAVGTLGLLNAAAAAAQTSVQLVQARASRLTDSVAMYQACGTAP